GRAVQHHADHRQAEQPHADAFGIEHHFAEHEPLQRLHHGAQELGQDGQDDGAQDHAGNMPHAAQHHHAQHRDRLGQAEALGADEALHGGEQRAGHAAERGAHGERQQLDVARVDAHGLGGDLILADRLPGAADARVLQAHADQHDQQRDGQQQVIVFFRAGHADAQQALAATEHELADLEAVDAVDALRPVGDVDRRVEIIEENADDLAEAQRDDGQVVAAQLQRGRAQQHAEYAGQPQADGQDRPERQVQVE